MINIEWLLENGPCKSYAAGEIIPFPRGGEDGQKTMYILLSGSIDVFGKSVTRDMEKISSIIAGDVFGGREYFTDTYDYVYRASEDVMVYLLTEESFNDLSWSQPDILFEILRSSYAPPRKPTSAAPATASEPTPAQAAKLPVAATEKVTGSIFLSGHKTYADKEFHMNKKLVYAKEYNCPFCGKTFSDFRVFRSKLYEKSPMRYDLRRFYTDFITEWYDILTCQKCYFSTFHTYFTEPKPLKKETIADKLTTARSEVHMDFSAARDINHVFSMHYLALVCCEGYPSLGRQLRAKILGNLSWLYEDVGDKEMEKLAASRAAEAYEQVYIENRLMPVQEQVTFLSIAGMKHRAGIDKDMKKFLLKAKTHATGDKTYASLAEDFMYELKIPKDEQNEPDE